MKKRGRIAAFLLAAAAVLNTSALNFTSALNADDVINETTDELQQDIINYIFVKNYLSGNIKLNDSFSKTLDVNNDGTINILDSTRLKQRILELSAAQKQEVTTTAVTTPTVTTTVTTAPVTTVTSVLTTVTPKIKKGDYVSYSGDAHYSASGSGNKMPVSGIFKVANILSESVYPYTVQLENAGWVALKDVVAVTTQATTTKATTTTAVTTTPAATTTPTATTALTTTTVMTVTGDLKKGDYVSYSGKAHYTASGNGTAVSVSGIFKIAEILTESVFPYTVQLENTGWVAYKDITGKDQPIVTTTVPVKEFDGNTYKIKNSASGKYLTVSGADDRANIFQSSSADGNTQLFKAASYYNTLNYRLYALCSDKGKVIDIVKNGENITEGCNIQLYDSVDPDAQTWRIEAAGNGKYKILSAKNPKVALTANGTADGTKDGKKPDSAGNVYLSEYKGTENQLWVFEKK